MGAVYITYYPDLAAPGALATRSARFTEDGPAQPASRRLVLLSGRGEEEAERCGAALATPALDWTILRCELVRAELQRGPSRSTASLAGERRRCRSDAVPEPFVDAEDIADVAVAALTDERPRRAALRAHRPACRSPSPTRSPRSPAPPAAHPLRRRPARALRRRAGRGRRAGRPGRALRYLFTEVLDGRNAHPQPTACERALGRPPRDFADYARDAAAAGAWSGPMPVSAWLSRSL